MLILSGWVGFASSVQVMRDMPVFPWFITTDAVLQDSLLWIVTTTYELTFLTH